MKCACSKLWAFILFREINIKLASDFFSATSADIQQYEFNNPALSILSSAAKNYFVPDSLYLKINTTTYFLAINRWYGPIQLRSFENIILGRVFKIVYRVTTYPYALFDQTSYFRLRRKQERERNNNIALWYKAKHPNHL